MKVDYRDNKLIVFFNKKHLILDKLNIDREVRSLLLKISKTFNIDFDGCYNIEVFIDDNIGTVLSIVKDNLEYYDYDLVDINVTLSNCDKFMFEYNDMFDMSFKCNYYLYKNKIYCLPIDYGFIDLGFVFEFSSIIYGSIVDDIMKDGEEIIL